MKKSTPWYIVLNQRKSTWNEEGYVVSVHPERYGIWKIESLTHPSTFYNVDPGSSRKKCLPPISSPDECHWEGNEFSKQRDDVCGIFKFFPMWDLNGLVKAGRHFQGAVHTNKELGERFRQVAAVPRHVFQTKMYTWPLCNSRRMQFLPSQHMRPQISLRARWMLWERLPPTSPKVLSLVT